MADCVNAPDFIIVTIVRGVVTGIQIKSGEIIHTQELLMG